MALIVKRNNVIVEKWSATKGSIEFIEKNEKAKPGVSLYNLPPEEHEDLSTT